jgi:hypothetical protein
VLDRATIWNTARDIIGLLRRIPRGQLEATAGLTDGDLSQSADGERLASAKASQRGAVALLDGLVIRYVSEVFEPGARPFDLDSVAYELACVVEFGNSQSLAKSIEPAFVGAP